MKLIMDVRAWVTGDGSGRAIAAPAALHVGERAHWLLSDAAGWRSIHHGRLLPALYGLPIVPATDLGTEWRVFNGAGAVIAEGFIDP